MPTKEKCQVDSNKQLHRIGVGLPNARQKRLRQVAEAKKQGKTAGDFEVKVREFIHGIFQQMRQTEVMLVENLFTAIVAIVIEVLMLARWASMHVVEG